MAHYRLKAEKGDKLSQNFIRDRKKPARHFAALHYIARTSMPESTKKPSSKLLAMKVLI
jgi:hypothetical protein